MVATVSAPPAVVCFKQYVFDHHSHSAAVVTCFLFGLAATGSHSFNFSSVTLCDGSFCRYPIDLLVVAVIVEIRVLDESHEEQHQNFSFPISSLHFFFGSG